MHFRVPYHAAGYSQIQRLGAPAIERPILDLEGAGAPTVTDDPVGKRTILTFGGGGGGIAMAGGRFNGDIYWDLASFGVDPNSPTATLSIGASGKAIVSFAANLRSGYSTVYGCLTISASGANVIVPGTPAFPSPGTDQHYICGVQLGANNVACIANTVYLSGLAPGVTTFTLNYASSQPCDFNNSTITAMAG